ncbi:MAG: hypothetical protein WKF41_09110 [Gaiellaceae bacterium]
MSEIPNENRVRNWVAETLDEGGVVGLERPEGETEIEMRVLDDVAHLSRIVARLGSEIDRLAAELDALRGGSPAPNGD